MKTKVVTRRHWVDENRTSVLCEGNFRGFCGLEGFEFPTYYQVRGIDYRCAVASLSPSEGEREIRSTALAKVRSFVAYAKAEFLEAVGDYAGAFEYFSKIEERYDGQKLVASFCARYKRITGDTRFDAEAQKRAGGLFPNGMEMVALKDFQTAPTDGVLIRQHNDLITNAGLAEGNVIVAVYGIRVHNFAQYCCGRETSAQPELDLIVWQRNHYSEIKAAPPNHRFGVDFGDYPAN